MGKLRLTLLFSMELMATLVLVMLDMLVLDIELMLDIPMPMGLMLVILMPMANKSQIHISFIQNNNTKHSKKTTDGAIIALRFYSQPVTIFPVLLIEYVGKL